MRMILTQYADSTEPSNSQAQEPLWLLGKRSQMKENER